MDVAQYNQQLLEENETLIKTLELMKKQLDIKLGKPLPTTNPNPHHIYI